MKRSLVFIAMIFVLFEFKFRTPGAIKVDVDGQERCGRYYS